MNSSGVTPVVESRPEGTSSEIRGSRTVSPMNQLGEGTLWGGLQPVADESIKNQTYRRGIQISELYFLPSGGLEDLALPRRHLAEPVWYCQTKLELCATIRQVAGCVMPPPPLPPVPARTTILALCQSSPKHSSAISARLRASVFHHLKQIRACLLHGNPIHFTPLRGRQGGDLFIGVSEEMSVSYHSNLPALAKCS